LLILLACSEPSEKLLFIREEAGKLELWQSEPLKNISGIPGKAFPGPLNPAGTVALVISQTEAGDLLYLLPLDGSPPQKLTPPAGRIRTPVWSPDAQWIYMSADWHIGTKAGPSGHISTSVSPEIYRVKAAGGRPERLTVSSAGSFEPAVSPDGSKVAFGRSERNNTEIYWMEASGAKAVRVTDSPGEDLHPVWKSNDELLWISSRSGQAMIWSMRLGGAERPLRTIPSGQQDLELVLSPDRRLAAVTVMVDGDIDIELVDLSTPSYSVRISAPGPDEHPAFSNDGWLAFTSSRGGHPAIWGCKTDGSSLKLLVETGEAAWLPHWTAKDAEAQRTQRIQKER
jgi:Tol biopolymer transport system component